MSDAAADFTLPELTRSLRALGSARWLRDADHARFFTPLLTARRNAARVRTAEGHVAAFQADRLRRAFTDAVEQCAAVRHPRSAPDGRALVARLTDAGAPVWLTLDALEEGASALTKASSAARYAAWSAWVVVLQRLFLEADAWWAAIVALRDGPRRDGGATGALALLLVLALAPAALQAQQHLTYRVTGLSAQTLQSRGFDVVGVEPRGALVVAEPRELARLQGLGAVTQLVTAPGADPRRAMQLDAVVAAPVVYRSYDDPVRGIRAWIDSLAAANAKVSVDTVGRSYQGRPILAVKIGPRGDAAARPNVLIVATHHAREWAATDFALRLIKRLATATDARTDSLVNGRDIWIVPVVNPDGYQYTFTNDRLWRKNRRPISGPYVGVDLNRNHSTNWGLDDVGSSPNPESEIYRGSSPASEPEVSALQQWHALHPPVVSISYHTYDGALLSPPGARNGVLASDFSVYRVLGGTNVHPAVFDHLPGSQRAFYATGPAWMLYPTNGEYTDWASTTYGTVSINPEITSGYGPQGYYGFEFPDDDALLQQLFTDNLPFALDAIEMARDPAAYRSPTTGLRADRWSLESGTQSLRVRGPAALMAGAVLSAAGQPVATTIDSTSGGKYMRRLISTAGASRPASISIASGSERMTWNLLSAAGAESGDPAWTMQGFVADTTQRYAGRASYRGMNGDLRSSVIAVPASIDTISLTFWNKYDGDGYSETPFGFVRASTDSGKTWDVVARMEGAAPVWYPEDLRIGGVRGKPLMLSFTPVNLPWWIDEVAVYAHASSAINGAGGTTAARFLPSANPVRGNVVTFTWPFVGAAGRVTIYDFTGHQIWTHAMAVTDADVTWDFTQSAIPNGVYLVLAESGGAHARLKLFIARGMP
jgi:hypothetical protein